MEILNKLYEMTALGEIANSPGSLLMLVIALCLLYLGIAKRFEPLLLVPIAFGVFLANFPGGNMAVTTVAEAPGIEHKTIIEIAKDHGIICLLYTSPSPRDKRQSRMPSSA